MTYREQNRYNCASYNTCKNVVKFTVDFDNPVPVQFFFAKDDF